MQYLDSMNRVLYRVCVTTAPIGNPAGSGETYSCCDKCNTFRADLAGGADGSNSRCLPGDFNEGVKGKF